MSRAIESFRRACFALVTSALAAAACTGTETGNPPFHGAVSFRTEPETPIDVVLDDDSKVSIDSALTFVRGTRLLHGSACTEPPRAMDDRIERAVDLAKGAEIGGLSLRERAYCGIDVAVRRATSEDRVHRDLVGYALLIGGRRTDGTPFTLRSRLQKTIRARASTALALSRRNDRVFVSFLVARWFENLDLDALEPDESGRIRIDESHHAAALRRFEQNFERSADVDGEEAPAGEDGGTDRDAGGDAGPDGGPVMQNGPIDLEFAARAALPPLYTSRKDLIAAVDLVGDEALDVVVGFNNGSRIDVYRRTGAWSFATAEALTTSGNPVVLETGHLDGDDRLDLVVGNENSADGAPNIDVYLNRATGVVHRRLRHARSGASSIRDLVLADADGDGRLDLVSANYDAHSISIFTNHGDGIIGTEDAGIYLPEQTFTPSLVKYPLRITAGEFDGDGQPDFLVTANTSDGKFARLLALWRSTDSFTSPVTLETSRAIDALRTVRVNGAIYGIAASPLGWLGMVEFDGTGAELTIADERGMTATSFTQLRVADLDRDGNEDLVVFGSHASTADSMWVVRPSASDLLPEPESFQQASPDAEHASIVDMDDPPDGKLDILVANTNEGALIRSIGTPKP